MAASSTNQSTGISITWIIHHYIHALYGHIVGAEGHQQIISPDDGDDIVRGDADDLAGGKIGIIGNGTREPGMVVPEGSGSVVTVTE